MAVLFPLRITDIFNKINNQFGDQKIAEWMFKFELTTNEEVKSKVSDRQGIIEPELPIMMDWNYQGSGNGGTSSGDNCDPECHEE